MLFRKSELIGIEQSPNQVVGIVGSQPFLGFPWQASKYRFPDDLHAVLGILCTLDLLLNVNTRLFDDLLLQLTIHQIQYLWNIGLHVSAIYQFTI